MTGPDYSLSAGWPCKSRLTGAGSGYRVTVTDLLPNLTDLLAALPDSDAGRDAAALATEAAAAASWPDATQRLGELAQTWANR